MKLLIGFIIVFFLIKLSLKKSSSYKRKRFLDRFKSRFKNKSRLREKISEEFSNSLMIDPEANISIGTWYSDIELKEKADIHRARLSKFGRSKINGEMLFLGPKGGVYKYNDDGIKKYV